LSAGGGSAGTSALIFIVFIIFVIAVRAFRTYSGMRFSQARTIFYIAFYFAFSAFFVGSSFFEGVPLIYAIPDAIVFALATWWAYGFAQKRITFWKSSDGSIFFKGGIIIYAIYVAALIARISVDFLFIGPSFFTFSPGLALSSNEIVGFTVTDLLLMLGIGLLVGRSLRLIKRYRNIRDGVETVQAL